MICVTSDKFDMFVWKNKKGLGDILVLILLLQVTNEEFERCP